MTKHMVAWRNLVQRSAARKLHYHPRPALMLAYVRAPEHAIRSTQEAPSRIAAFGARAFLAGALGLVAVSAITGSDTTVAGTRALTAVVWAFARLGVMLFFARGDQRAAIATGWAAGLLPYLVGVTLGLRAVAFFISAIYTDAALTGVGIDRERSHSLVVRAFGAQGIVVGALWAARAIIAAVVMLGASF
ncbi:MAG: hypothetical protein Q7J82_06780 [Coriobacteriia bacterium]|nr:hypothetical protein [Coriobacteriia bacterium]